MTTINLIRVQLQLDEPWCVGAPEASASSVRLPTATDPFGAVVVPASSVAGSLRHHLTQQPELDVIAVMGGADSHDDLQPSALRVLGVEVRLPKDKAVTDRTQTAMDVHRGAAANHMLRTSELAPSGTVVTVDLRVDGHHDWYGDLMLALTTWAPFIGRARTSGMGAAHVTQVRHGSLNLANSDDLQRWLASGGPELVADVANQSLPVPKGPTGGVTVPLDTALTWRTRDALLIGGDKSGSARKPYTRDGQLTVEGSSWKGVLRSRVGYVARSVGATSCSDATGCDAPDCPLCLLFGSTTRRGALRTRASVVQPGRSVDRDHVAIDRFTGGSRDHLLFSDKDLPLDATLELDLTWLDGEPPAWVRPLVAAALLDLHDGYAGIGAKTTSGYGTVSLPHEVAQQLRTLLTSDSGDWIAELDTWRQERLTAKGSGE